MMMMKKVRTSGQGCVVLSVRTQISAIFGEEGGVCPEVDAASYGVPARKCVPIVLAHVL